MHQTRCCSTEPGLKARDEDGRWHEGGAVRRAVPPRQGARQGPDRCAVRTPHRILVREAHLLVNATVTNNTPAHLTPHTNPTIAAHVLACSQEWCGRRCTAWRARRWPSRSWTARSFPTRCSRRHAHSHYTFASHVHHRDAPPATTTRSIRARSPKLCAVCSTALFLSFVCVRARRWSARSPSWSSSSTRMCLRSTMSTRTANTCTSTCGVSTQALKCTSVLLYFGNRFVNYKLILLR